MIDGALLLDKPLGVSSNFVLQRAKKLLAAGKAGHAGTLDPLASGLLIALFGEATKFAGLLLDSEKEYAAKLKLGETTATADAEGKVLKTCPVEASAGDVRDVLKKFEGEIEQVPPMHSALKREGVPLYKLARRGETVERAARRVRILELALQGYDSPFVEIRVRCSKGTYIRTLAEDIGAALGCGAHLAGLRRTGSGRFRVDEAVALEALEAMGPAERRARLLPVDSLLSQLPRVELDAASEVRLRNGQSLQMPALPEGVSAVYGPGGALIGLGRAESGILRPLRLTQVPEKG
ncbi:MAG TPA: tRNA pseudouridine(55) synthase TruB [Burkholderiales bacterium]|nr:tRNA pseudouridine(55) synthase TruB [Burkholderiales bacterium]